ncbi:MAG: hypothetical protein K2J80_07465 [Oscillospiraceae bacterium]|nr:hypothetical protein [Oscillospiraceae bacterium]
MAELSKTIAVMESDDLIVGTQPPCRAGGATVKKGAGELRRGTIMAKGSDGLLDVLGKDTEAEAYGILTDDINAADEDLSTTIYISGKFNSNKITVADGYTITEKDKDTLRKYGIELTAALSY